MIFIKESFKKSIKIMQPLSSRSDKPFFTGKSMIFKTVDNKQVLILQLVDNQNDIDPFYDPPMVLYMSFDRFLLAVESRDRSQADKRNIRVSSFPRLCDG